MLLKFSCTSYFVSLDILDVCGPCQPCTGSEVLEFTSIYHIQLDSFPGCISSSMSMTTKNSVRVLYKSRSPMTGSEDYAPAFFFCSSRCYIRLHTMSYNVASSHTWYAQVSRSPITRSTRSPEMLSWNFLVQVFCSILHDVQVFYPVANDIQVSRSLMTKSRNCANVSFGPIRYIQIHLISIYLSPVVNTMLQYLDRW